MGAFQGGVGESRVVGNVFQMGRGEDGDWHQGAGERGADWHQGAGEGYVVGIREGGGVIIGIREGWGWLLASDGGGGGY